MEQIKEQLKKKYGEPTEQIDFLKSAVSIWDDDPTNMRDEIRRIREEKLKDSYYWLPPEYKQVGNVVSLLLEAEAVSGATGLLSLAFEYPNMKACHQRRDDKASDAF